MALSTYAELQTAVLGWLARPGDPLVAPAVPDMITLFEAEANRRLRVIDAERHAVLTMDTNGFMVLPQDCWAIRSVALNGLQLQFMPPGSEVFSQPGGSPRYYSLLGYNQGAEDGQGGQWLEFWLFVGPTAGGTIELMYQVGVPPLGATRPTNWLLETHPDAYTFGTLAEAELYIGHDERAPLWLQRRDAAFQSIENYDRKTRWAGPMQIRAHGIQTGVGSAAGGAAPAPVPLPGGAGAGITVSSEPPANPANGAGWWDSSSTLGGGQLYIWYNGQWVAATNQAVGFPEGIATATPGSGEVVTISRDVPSLYISSGPLAALTVRLWDNPALGETAQISFANPVTALTVTNSGGTPVSGGPTSAYGPGAALVFRFSPPGVWAYWK